MRKLILLGWLLLIGVSSVLSAQRPAKWSVWLYNGSDGTFTQVAPDGNVQQVVEPGGYFNTFSGYGAASGDLLAYGEIEFVQDQESFPGQIVLYSQEKGKPLATYPLNSTPPGFYGIHQEGFNNATRSLTISDAGDSIAFGYHFRTNPDNADIYGWEVVALDGLSYDALRSEDVSKRLRIHENIGYDVHIWRYADGVVTFRLTPIFVHQDVDPVTVEWHVETGEARVIDFDVPLNSVSHGDTFVYQRDLEQINLYDAATAETSTIYSVDEGEVISAHFIQNGERIAAHFIETPGEISLVVLELDGTEVTRLEKFSESDLFYSTPDGFVYRTRENQLAHITTFDDSFAQTKLVEEMLNVYTIDVQIE